MIRPEVKRLKGYRLERPAHTIKLNQNESPYDLPPAIKEKILQRIGEVAWNRYPTPFCDSLAKKIAEREGWDPEGVVVAGGSNILIQAVAVAAAAGRPILTVDPGFSLYEIEGRLLGSRVVKVPLNPDNFSLPVDRFLKRLAATRPAVVFLANPNAPTGTLFLEEALLKIVKKGRGLVLIDEAYHQFAGQNLLPYLKRHPNLILLRTLSKAFSLGGVRLGYLLAGPSLAAEIKKVILPFSVGVLSQAVGEAVLDDSAYVDRLVSEIVRERETLYDALTRIPSLKVTRSAANFILFQCRASRQLFEDLLQAGILIRDVSSQRLPHALRVTVGSPEENRRFLQAIKEIAKPS